MLREEVSKREDHVAKHETRIKTGARKDFLPGPTASTSCYWVTGYGYREDQECKQACPIFLTLQ